MRVRNRNRTRNRKTDIIGQGRNIKNNKTKTKRTLTRKQSGQTGGELGGEKVSTKEYFAANRVGFTDLVGMVSGNIVKNTIGMAAVGAASLAGLKPANSSGSLADSSSDGSVTSEIHDKIDNATVLYTSITDPLLKLAKVPLSVSGAIISSYLKVFNMQAQVFAPQLQAGILSTVVILKEQLAIASKTVEAANLIEPLKKVLEEISNMSDDLAAQAEPVMERVLPKLAPVLTKALDTILHSMLIASTSVLSAVPIIGTAFAAVTSLDALVKMAMATTQAGAATAEAFLDGYSETILKLKHKVPLPPPVTTPSNQSGGERRGRQHTHNSSSSSSSSLVVVPFSKIVRTR